METTLTRRAARLLTPLLLVMALAAPPVAAQPGPSPALRFGVVDSAPSAGGASPDAAQLGIGWERITFDWAAFQPAGPDDFVTASVDAARLEAASGAGREVVGLIVHTPAWASAAGTPAAVPDGITLPVGDPANAWAAFVTRLAAHYAPLGVHRWIVYDTPDVRQGEGVVQFAGTVEQYAHMLRTAFHAARAVDPEARLHVAAVAGWADAAAGRDPYLARLLRAFAADPDAPANGTYFDAVMLRVYDTTQAVWDAVTAARAILSAAGLADKTVWLETNARPTSDPASLFPITAPQQADFVMQAAALALAAGADRVGIIPLADSDDQPWGLLRADGSHRPAFDAYRTAITLYAPTIAAGRYTHVAAELIVLEQAERDVYVMWARDQQAVQFVVTSPAVSETARYHTALGRTWIERSAPFDWPAAFLIDAPAALRDANGFLTVAGSPRVLVLDHTPGFQRVVYLVAGGDTFRIK